MPYDTLNLVEKISDNNLNLFFKKYITHNKDKAEYSIFSMSSKLLKNLEEKQNKYLNSIYEKNHTSFDKRIKNKLIVGLGDTSVVETSMTLHHVYGIPYIPAQALKGISRYCFLNMFFDEKVSKNIGDFEKELESSCYPNKDVQSLYEKLFGTQAISGSVVYFDSYPDNSVQVAEDIMTPHYGDYYTKGEPPADSLTPVPIKFLVLQKGSFQFNIATKKDLVESEITFLKSNKTFSKYFNENNELTLLNVAKLILSYALEKNGVGAKTSLGYGLFEF